MVLSTGRQRHLLDPEAQRRRLLALHPALTTVEPWRGEKPIFYAGRQYRSVSEAKWALWMAVSGIDFDYEPVKTFRSDLTGYKPDFYLSGAGFLLEVADFSGRYTPEKALACREAAERLDLPVVLLRGFPWFQDEKPIAKIATVFLPRGLDIADPEVAAAWPTVVEFLGIVDSDSRALMRKVVNCCFEDLDPYTGQPKAEKLRRFERTREKTLQQVEQLGPVAHRLHTLLSCGYPERRYSQISTDMGCSRAQAAMACYQLSMADLAPADIAAEWRSVNLSAVKEALAREAAA